MATPSRSVADFFTHVVRVKESSACALRYHFVARLWRDNTAVAHKIGVIPTILAPEKRDWRLCTAGYTVHSKLDVRARARASAFAYRSRARESACCNLHQRFRSRHG
jgi:hypothetical protein